MHSMKWSETGACPPGEGNRAVENLNVQHLSTLSEFPTLVISKGVT